jgi:hypothetical protein
MSGIESLGVFASVDNVIRRNIKVISSSEGFDRSALQMYALEGQASEKSRTETYMALSVSQDIEELAPHMPVGIRVFLELNAEDAALFHADPSIPMPLISGIVDIRCVASVFPFLVLNIDRLELAIRIDIISEYEIASLHVVDKIGSRGSRNGTEEGQLVQRRGTFKREGESLCVEMERDKVEVCFLFFFIRHDLGQIHTIQPEQGFRLVKLGDRCQLIGSECAQVNTSTYRQFEGLHADMGAFDCRENVCCLLVTMDAQHLQGSYEEERTDVLSDMLYLVTMEKTKSPAWLASAAPGLLSWTRSFGEKRSESVL